jgi:hypothetical protein
MACMLGHSTSRSPKTLRVDRDFPSPVSGFPILAAPSTHARRVSVHVCASTDAAYIAGRACSAGQPRPTAAAANYRAPGSSSRTSSQGALGCPSRGTWPARRQTRGDRALKRRSPGHSGAWRCMQRAVCRVRSVLQACCRRIAGDISDLRGAGTRTCISMVFCMLVAPVASCRRRTCCAPARHGPSAAPPAPLARHAPDAGRAREHTGRRGAHEDSGGGCMQVAEGCK